MTQRKIWPRDYITDNSNNIGVGCPNCGCKRSKVVYTRHKENNKNMRRRECEHCGRRYTTFETV